MSSISNVSSNYLQTLLADSIGSTSRAGTSASSSSISSLGSSSDSTRLSPFGQLLSTLQKLQQSNPDEYKSVMLQISTNLTDAAKTATSDGDADSASKLTQLASDFKSAGESGSLPNIQDLAQALDGPGNGPPPPPAGLPSDSASIGDSSSGGSSDSSSLSEALTKQILAAFGGASGSASSSQSQAYNPMTIIMKTLSDAGLIGSNS